ncbi:MAG: molecular chaperone TorD, partial [Methylotenera sp.]|nr:molecular chaperone TorD [Methylotenera sp.]
IGLLVLSYLAINFTNTYLDFTGPIAWAIMYFSVAKIYALANARAMQRLLANDVESGKKGAAILLMPIVIDSTLPLSDGMLKKLQHKVEQELQQAATVEILKGTQSGIWGLFTDIITISWAYQHDNEAEAEKAQQDATQLGLKLKSLLQNIGMPNDATVRYILHASTLNTEKPMASQWRTLFAQAIIKLEVLEREPL